LDLIGYVDGHAVYEGLLLLASSWCNVCERVCLPFKVSSACCAFLLWQLLSYLGAAMIDAFVVLALWWARLGFDEQWITTTRLGFGEQWITTARLGQWCKLGLSVGLRLVVLSLLYSCLKLFTRL
jgi:hypothetical protein